MNSLKKIEYQYDFHKHYELSMKKDAYKSQGLCGLVNIRNTCFINSIIQCLSNTLRLSDYILSGKYKEDESFQNRSKPAYYVLLSYIGLISNIWNENQLIKPKTFVENLSKIHKKYFSLRQQDSHECLLYILDLLHDALSYEVEVDISGQVKTVADKLTNASLQTWKTFYEKGYSYIIETFYGSTISTSTCNQCNDVACSFEPYNTISLSINDEARNLDECLTEYFKDDVISDWKCEKCNGNNCSRDVKLWTAPNYLIIHLKRFKNDESNVITKNTQFIDFPINNLDITKYICNKKNDSNNYIYDLYAVNHHSGDLTSGHYWASCRNLDEHWYVFNDGNVSRCNTNNIHQNLITNDAYILFYHRKFIKKPLQV